MKKIILGLTTIFMFGCGTSKDEEGIKASLTKAYYAATHGDNQNIFYNDDFQMKAVLMMMPTLLELNNQISFEPRNLEIVSYTDDSAEIMYDLVITVKGEERDGGNLSMKIKKVGNEWKFDARNFFGKLDDYMKSQKK